MRRTHRIRLYAPPGVDADPYDSTDSAWTAGAETVANLQPLTGSVQQTAAGRAVGATWQGFVPAGVAVEEDQGVLVLEGVGPSRYRVRQVGEQGAGWDTELLLAETLEEFGE